MGEIITMNLSAEPGADFTNLEQQARRLFAPKHRKLTLLAWWDDSMHVGGPLETCADESIQCVIKYAVGHGATHRVRVNRGQYDLFYGSPKEEYAELDRRLVLEIHRDAHTGEFDNVQGG